MTSGASAADVRSILQLPAASSSSLPPTQTAAETKGRRKQKPDGISRELYALIGTSAPSLSVQIAKPKFKAKPNLGGTAKAAKWEWREFSNSGRKDSMKLRHWVKASTDPDVEYPFAKYNIPSQVPTYSQDEYSKHLYETTWTKEETDYLMGMAREYDLRFFVIADRYDYPGGVPRSIEDIKDRYYGVCRRLHRNRPWPGDESSRLQTLAGFMFDKEREVTRKKYIASLENRTPDQIAEEEALYVEIKKLEANERRFALDRENLLRTLAGMDSGLASIAISTAADEETFAAVFDAKNMKKRRGTEAESPVVATPGVISLGAPASPTRKVQSAKNAAQDALFCIQRNDTNTTTVTKAAHHPVMLRSFKIPQPKSGQAPKITQALGELNINHTRLVMPTRENVQLLESLIDAATALIETKKVVDKVEQDIRVARAQLAERDGKTLEEGVEDLGGSPDGDGDDGGGEVDGERAASVATSVRSLGRKRIRRSISISSVDTAATNATRASRKRQKAT